MPVANFREKKSNICQCPSQFYLDKILNLARQDPVWLPNDMCEKKVWFSDSDVLSEFRRKGPGQRLKSIKTSRLNEIVRTIDSQVSSPVERYATYDLAWFEHYT